MAAVDALASRIEDLGVGTVGTTIFIDSMPDAADGSLDTCTVIYQAGGGAPVLTQGDNTDLPGFQVIARSLSATTALTNLLTIFQSFHGLTETDVHGVHFKLLYAVNSNPIPLGRDERQRFLYSMSFRSYIAGITRQ